MQLARVAVVLVAALLLAGGYLASQYSFFAQTTAAYVKALDASPVPILALVLLLASVVLAFIPAEQPHPQEDGQ